MTLVCTHVLFHTILLSMLKHSEWPSVYTMGLRLFRVIRIKKLKNLESMRGKQD